MKDVLIKKILSEMAKQVGDVYHFTKQENLESILDSGKLMTIAGHISTTRNYNLPYDLNQVNGNYDLSHKHGYNTRITLDGNKISEHHKIKPLNGVTAAVDDAHDITKYKNNRVSRHEHEAEEAIHDKSIDVLRYTKHIHVVPHSEDHIQHYNTVLRPKLDKLKISHSIGRKFHPTKSEELEIYYSNNKLNEMFVIEVN